jgi:surface carbohydrate biosynthesis protein
LTAGSAARKVWETVRDTVRARKEWRPPRRSDVLIYDAEGADTLMSYLAPWNPELLHVRGDQVNVPVLAKSIRGLARLNRFAYADAFVKQVAPKLVVTYIDNAQAFHTLASRHNGLKTLFIQNGTRVLAEARSVRAQARKVDFMMVFGRHIGDAFAQRIAGAVVPMGSLKNNAAPRVKASQPGTLVFISQFRKSPGEEANGRFYPREEFYERTDQAVVPFLLRYAREHGKSFAIVPSFRAAATSSDEERRYYRSLLGEDCAFADEPGEHGSYDAVDKAEVVVSIDSTLAYESAARGNKTAFFPVRMQPSEIRERTFGWPGRYPDDGPFWTNRPDPAAFGRILDHLFSITRESYAMELRQHRFEDIMTYDPGNTLLKAVLQRELGSAGARQDHSLQAIQRV